MPILADLTTAELLSWKQSTQTLRRLTQSSQNEAFLRETAQAITGESEATAKPHPRQAEFGAMEGEEGLFGGSVGGGKTAALIRCHRDGVQ